MEAVEWTRKARRSAFKDVITRMPENVIINILNRLPMQNAVATSILSRKWRFKWTMLTQLVFDEEFCKYLQRTVGKGYYDGRNIISRVLLHLECPVPKFVLYIPNYAIIEDEDINHWVMFLSRNGIKEFTLLNMHEKPLKLPTHIFSFREMRHLKLRNCSLKLPPRFCGFPDLLSLDFYEVTYDMSDNIHEDILTNCPLLEFLKIRYHNSISKVKLAGIIELENLKYLSLPLRKLESKVITSSTIFKLGGYLPKLQELNLDFRKSKFIAEAGPRKWVYNAYPQLRALTLYPVDIGSDVMVSCAKKWVCTLFPCLKTLEIFPCDFSRDSMLSWAFDMIWGSPNLQTLKITVATYKDPTPPALDFSKFDCSTMRPLQLWYVVIRRFRGLENEISFLKRLLAYSPMLKIIIIRLNELLVLGDKEKLKFATKLLELPRASPVAEVKLYHF